MNNEQNTNQNFEIKLLCELHEGLERQGPGSPEMTMKALSFLDGLNENARVADMGCGTGGQTIILAQNIGGRITGVDFFPEFIDVFNDNVKKQNFGERINGIVGSMDDLPFPKEEFDLIWSEGAIDNIGFEKGLRYWHGFLKKGGYVAVTCPSWLTDERPAEIEKHWADAGSSLDSIEDNLAALQRAGYVPVAMFTLPANCWTENYFIPRDAALKALLEKYPDNETAESFAADMRHEVELFSNYKDYYGYVFYIGKRR